MSKSTNNFNNIRQVTSKITGMLLELNREEIKDLLENDQELENKVQEARRLIDSIPPEGNTGNSKE